ncbi:hypothetical protein HHL16_11610 [Pseudoflavitalea sp. G-6-1-2]|uniref:DUF6895 family protein n=1 Tax=Pseudoflavitalea sp. G-6-1-2 TaxID=2728841 RepID=UPI001469BE17|nr:hypothetical protein [Pseudoflavitalea sp. G-6-1-2]NML21525.1 hypothetical protein [Pseudoflavitalea sp. G-6-1-2]
MTKDSAIAKAGTLQPGRDELFRRLDDILDFAIKNIQQIDMRHNLWNESIGPSISFADKVITETSLLALLAKRAADKHQYPDQKIFQLCKLLDPQVRGNQSKRLLMHNPQAAVVFGIGHAALNAAGIENALFDHFIMQAFSSGEVFNTERLPYRKMDVIWLNNLLRPDNAIGFETTLPDGILNSRAHPIYMNTADIYSVTHALMYVTDFGRYRVPDTVDHAYINAVIDAATAHHLLSDNLDIVGELIMSAVLMGNTDSLSTGMAWELLTAMWDKFGFLPCPTFVAADFQSLSGSDATAYAFRHLYHTMYVGGILCCLLLNEAPAVERKKKLVSTNRTALASKLKECAVHAAAFAEMNVEDELEDYDPANADPLPDDEVLQFLIEKIAKHFVQNGSSKYLLAVIKQHPEWQGPAMLNILIDSMLVHAAQEYDMNLLSEMLNLVAVAGLPVTLTAEKSADFLANQQLPEGAIGAWFVEEANLTSENAAVISGEFAKCLYRFGMYLNAVDTD